MHHELLPSSLILTAIEEKMSFWQAFFALSYFSVRDYLDIFEASSSSSASNWDLRPQLKWPTTATWNIYRQPWLLILCSHFVALFRELDPDFYQTSITSLKMVILFSEMAASSKYRSSFLRASRQGLRVTQKGKTAVKISRNTVTVRRLWHKPSISHLLALKIGWIYPNIRVSFCDKNGSWPEYLSLVLKLIQRKDGQAWSSLPSNNLFHWRFLMKPNCPYQKNFLCAIR